MKKKNIKKEKTLTVLADGTEMVLPDGPGDKRRLRDVRLRQPHLGREPAQHLPPLLLRLARDQQRDARRASAAAGRAGQLLPEDPVVDARQRLRPFTGLGQQRALDDAVVGDEQERARRGRRQRRERGLGGLLGRRDGRSGVLLGFFGGEVVGLEAIAEAAPSARDVGREDRRAVGPRGRGAERGEGRGVPHAKVPALNCWLMVDFFFFRVRREKKR